MIICQYKNICFATALASQLLADEGESLMFFFLVFYLKIKVIFCTFIWHHLQTSPLKIRNNVQKKQIYAFPEVRWGGASYVSEAKV